MEWCMNSITRILGDRISAAAGVLVLTALSMGIAQADGGLIDTHVHLHHGKASLEEYRAQLADAKLGLGTAGIMWFGGGNQALQGDVESIRAHNDQLIALAATDPKLMPIATVHPYDGDAALTELERVAKKGVKVLKIHPHTQKFDSADPRVLALVRRAGELNVIVMLDNASILPGDCEKLFNLALEAPKTTFIFAHLGGLNFRFWNILQAARTAENLFGENIYFDISATAALVADSPIADEFVWTMRNVGVDHVLLGSDFPQFTLAQNVAALEKLKLTDSEKAAIRHENAERLLGLQSR
jgi:predicted TIM-barrel fold metal-dependent hydrolase